MLVLLGGLGAGEAATVIASYPLTADLADATGTYADATLAGTTLPTGPSSAGICVDGTFEQMVRTPYLGGVDVTDFELEVEFRLEDLPAALAPIVVAGASSRWIGLYVNSVGAFGAKYNNSNYLWSAELLTPGAWYRGQIRYQSGELQLFLDGAIVARADVGALDTGTTRSFMTSDYSNSTALNGCVRNLVVANDTTLAEAWYPLVSDLVDATGGYGDVVLQGSPPPSSPAPESPLCHNGLPLADPSGLGQSIATPPITGLDATDFELRVEFALAELPADLSAPVLICGESNRWLGIVADATGRLGVRYQDGLTAWSQRAVTTGSWFAAQLRYEAGQVQLLLDGDILRTATIGPLAAAGDEVLTTTDLTLERALPGCIRNLSVVNDATLELDVFGDGFESGDLVAWSDSAP